MRYTIKNTLRRVVLAAFAAAQSNRLLLLAARLVIPRAVRVRAANFSRATPAYDISLPAFERLLETAEPVHDETSDRLVMCCGALYPGGAERQIVNTLCGLAQYGQRERLILLADRLTRNQPERYDFYFSTLQAAAIEAREFRRGEGGKHSRRRLPRGTLAAINCLPLMTDIIDLYREFIDIKPAVVHAWLDWSNVRAGLAAVLAGVPKIILSGRNLNPSNFFFDAPYYLPAYQALAECPRVTLINNSEAGAEDYAQWMGVARERVSVVRNGVDFDELARPSPQAVAALRIALGAAPGVPLVGGLFRFSPEKRPELWIETAALISAAHEDSRFALFGTGPLRNDMIVLARELGLGNRLTIRDVTREPLVALAAFDACLLTSSAEGTSNVALEAQWLGTPVIATAGGGTRESLDLGASGWLVDQPDANALAQVVLQVLADQKLKAVAAVRGPAFIKARFGMDRMLRETLDLYGIKSERHALGSGGKWNGHARGIISCTAE
jgi:glycosyltransferase involved in cell wall biosynthesis